MLGGPLCRLDVCHASRAFPTSAISRVMSQARISDQDAALENTNAKADRIALCGPRQLI